MMGQIKINNKLLLKICCKIIVKIFYSVDYVRAVAFDACTTGTGFCLPSNWVHISPGACIIH